MPFHITIASPRIPANLDPAHPAPKRLRCLPASQILGRPPEALRQVSVAGIIQPNFEVHPSVYNVVRRVELPPRLSVARVLGQVLSEGVVILVLDPDNATRVKQFLGPKLCPCRKFRRVHQRDVGDVIPLVPVLPPDVVRLQILVLAFGHVPVGIITDKEFGRDVLVEAAPVENLPTVEFDLEESPAIPAAHAVPILVLYDECVIPVWDAEFGGLVFELSEASLGLMEKVSAVGMQELPVRVGGILVSLGLDGYFDISAIATVDGVVDAVAGRGFGRSSEGGRGCGQFCGRRRWRQVRPPRGRSRRPWRLGGAVCRRPGRREGAARLCRRRRGLRLRLDHHRTGGHPAVTPRLVRVGREAPRRPAVRGAAEIRRQIVVGMGGGAVGVPVAPCLAREPALGRRYRSPVIHLVHVLAATLLGIRHALHLHGGLLRGILRRRGGVLRLDREGVLHVLVEGVQQAGAVYSRSPQGVLVPAVPARAAHAVAKVVLHGQRVRGAHGEAVRERVQGEVAVCDARGRSVADVRPALLRADEPRRLASVRIGLEDELEWLLVGRAFVRRELAVGGLELRASIGSTVGAGGSLPIGSYRLSSSSIIADPSYGGGIGVAREEESYPEQTVSLSE
mmetsp:Transcript_25330/g.60883  ORF Transcript_25330/g.60883 Transcript_25330/m.60883 type:complete len:623 (+) Transcript_25330:414-2282(+)